MSDLDVILARIAEVEAKIDALSRHVAPPAPTEARKPFPKVREWAAANGFSLRKARALVATGLPTIGSGAGLRVDAGLATDWLRRTRVNRTGPQDRARLDARRAATVTARRRAVEAP